MKIYGGKVLEVFRRFREDSNVTVRFMKILKFQESLRGGRKGGDELSVKYVLEL